MINGRFGIMHIKFDDNSTKAMRRKLERLADFGIVNEKELRKANREVAKKYVSVAKKKIEPMDREFTTVRGNRMYRKTLERSMGVWRPKADDKFTRNIMMAGPRTSLHRRVAPYSKKDGLFALWVEKGVAGKNKTSGRNVGVFERSLKAAMPQMRTKFLSEYRKRFGKYVRSI